MAHGIKDSDHPAPRNTAINILYQPILALPPFLIHIQFPHPAAFLGIIIKYFDYHYMPNMRSKSYNSLYPNAIIT